MHITLEFNETFNGKMRVQRFGVSYLYSTSRLEEITNSHPRDSSVRNLVCAVFDGALTIEGQWLKAVLKRGSLNNTISLMLFAGQSGEGRGGGGEFFLVGKKAPVKLPLAGAYFRPSTTSFNQSRHEDSLVLLSQLVNDIMIPGRARFIALHVKARHNCEKSEVAFDIMKLHEAATIYDI